MIRKHLATAKAATFCIALPSQIPNDKGFPRAAGTGFFVSSDGWFVTALHVIMSNNAIRADIHEMNASQHHSAMTEPWRVLSEFKLEFCDQEMDFALLKADLSANQAKYEWFREEKSFPFLPISTRELDEGEPVFSFGYPLSETQDLANLPIFDLGAGISGSGIFYSPRTTSAIISSTVHIRGPIWTNTEPKRYVIDKALNFGNSGGPIIASETGNVCALCSAYQPVRVPQHHLQTGYGPLIILVPSLYGVVSNLSDPRIIDALGQRGIPVQTD
jgi:serine protease Do